MSQFEVPLTVYPRNGGSPEQVTVLVDTGAAYTVLPGTMVQRLGCEPVRSQRVVLADGRREEWAVCHVEVECQGRRTITPVLMAPPESPTLLGATTLEELGLGVDPINRRLVPVELYLAPVSSRPVA